MDIQELVIKIIYHIKKGPFREISNSPLSEFARSPIPIIKNEEWTKQENFKFNKQTETYLHQLKSSLKEDNNLETLNEQVHKMADTVLLLKQNRILAEPELPLFYTSREENELEYKKRIEVGELFLEMLKRKIDLLVLENKMNEPDNHEDFDYDENGLTYGLKIGELKVNMNGAELAFYMQVFRKAGWFSGYEKKVLDYMFAEVLNQNIEILMNGEYTALKHFASKLSYAKSDESDKLNKKRRDTFKEILKETIAKAEIDFLSEESNYNLSKI